MACRRGSIRLRAGSSAPESLLMDRYRRIWGLLGSRRWRGWSLAWAVVGSLSCQMALASDVTQLLGGVVRYVADGDTVYVRPDGHHEQIAVRLLGIDAPEICQAGGVAARQALQDLLQDQWVELRIERRDDYGRQLAQIHWQGRDVGRWMVQQGLAWSYRYGRDPGPYLKEQQAARAAGLGLFSQPSPEPPSAFRRRHGSCKPAP